MKRLKFYTLCAISQIMLLGCGVDPDLWGVLDGPISGIPEVRVDSEGEIVERVKLCIHYIPEKHKDIMQRFGEYNFNQVVSPLVIGTNCPQQFPINGSTTIYGSIEVDGLFEYLASVSKHQNISVSCRSITLDVYVLDTGSGFTAFDCDEKNKKYNKDNVEILKKLILENVGTTG